ncbi:MAG: BamA/TamA family outer membrane protein [Candidatus Cloacimonetes bacterium]|nr:BamA/TamA family outer membrane protein [Candidatus Cloacimonadota bacterium]
MKRSLLAAALLLAWVLAPALSVEKISFSANFGLDEAALLQASGLQTGSQYDPADVNAAIAAMRAWLQNSGHPFVKIANPELIPLSESGMELAFRLTEVLPAEACELRFRGLRYFSEGKLRDLLLLSDNAQMPVSGLVGLMDRVLDEYHRRGYLFASVQLDSLTVEDGLTAYIGIDEGKPLKPEKFYFQGNKYTRDKTLIKLAGFNSGQVLTPEAIRAAEDNILAKSYIEACLIEPVDPSSLLIKIEEGRMTSLEGVLGYTGAGGKNEFTGFLNLGFLNLWGSDRSLSLNWRKLPLSSLLQFAYHESGPNNFPLAADLRLWRADETDNWIRSAISADVYSYFADHHYGLEFAAESVNYYVPASKDSLLVETTSTRSIGAFWRLDSRDRAFNPSKGMQTKLIYRLRQSGERGWNNALEADHTQYIGISRRWTCALGVHLRSLADTSSVAYEVYRLGGYNSLRGYREDEFSSWRLGWADLEIRYLISSQARVYLFYGHGLLARGENDLRADLLAPGLGIRLRTRLGILSIEYALGYRENGFPSLSAGMVHAGLDASF